MRRVNPKEYSEKYFENYCTGYDHWQNSAGQKMDPRLEAAFKLGRVRTGMTVVDYGCGRGELVTKSSLRGAIATGFDYSIGAINMCRKIVPKNTAAKFELIKRPNLKLKDKSVDIIFFVDVIEHLYPEEVDIVLKEFKRILKTKGKLIVHTAPNKDFYNGGYVWFSRYANKLANLLWPSLFGEKLPTTKNPRDKLEKKLHVNECNKEDLVTYLKQAGFKKTKVWCDSEFRKIRLRDKIRFNLLQPNWGKLKRWFAFDLWAIAQVV